MGWRDGQWLRVLTAFPQVLSSIPSNHMVTTTCNGIDHLKRFHKTMVHTCFIHKVTLYRQNKLYFYRNAHVCVNTTEENKAVNMRKRKLPIRVQEYLQR